ncbi:uncharacterized protein LOC122023444 isoform X2 [Zingiber officinale]|uniref:uncharacterized protein LOC122023444 isoform X2 n=1 Tax=Zingiber officinale TaxID=94328 RepID=UPI001C4C3781|nr:uncharacterized protein LOC122023444 isoform X2 [Zingiber officinale]
MKRISSIASSNTSRSKPTTPPSRSSTQRTAPTTTNSTTPMTSTPPIIPTAPTTPSLRRRQLQSPPPSPGPLRSTPPRPCTGISAWQRRRRITGPQSHPPSVSPRLLGRIPWRLKCRRRGHLARSIGLRWRSHTRSFEVFLQVGGGYTQRGGGRRGRFSFRGGRGRGNGNFSLNPSKHGVGEPSYNGRGRGQGTKGKRGSSLNHLSITSQSPNPAIVSMTGSLSVVDGNPTPAVSAALQSKVPMQPLFPIAWCDICRVDCNRLEVLEQHKNGKRHKKTVQKLQEIQAQQNLMADLHSNYVGKSELLFPSMEGANLPSLAETNIFSHLRGEKIVTSAPVSSGQVGEAENAIAISGNTSFTLETAPTSETNIKPTPSVTVVSSEVSEANRCSAASESLMPAIAGIGHKVEPEVPCQTVATQSESSKEERAEKEATTSTMPDFIDVPDCIDVPAVEGRRRIARMTTGRGRMARMNNYDRRHGTKKRAMSYQLDGRRLKRHEVAGARNQERQKHQPMVCTVCNVRCDTLAVFECHLSGKKHISKIKRSQGQNTVFGRITVDILPSQSTTCAPQGPEPLFYGLLSPDVFQKAAGVAEGAQTEAIAFSSQSQQQQQLQPEIVAVGSQSQQPQVQSEGSIPSSKLQEEATNMHIKGLPSVPKIESDEPCQLPDSPKELDPTGDFLFMPTLSK